MADRTLRCPACDAPMQQVDRRGVLIDICGDCRGVFLDRGELDKLLDTAAASPDLSGASAPEERHVSHDDERRGERDTWSDERDREWSGRRDHDWERKRGRRRGFLDDIFDFD